MNKEEHKNINRRGFLSKLWKVLGAVALFELVYVLFSFLLKRKREPLLTDQFFDAGAVSDFKNGSITPYRSRKFYLLRNSDGGFLAISLACSHLGCAVNWEEKKRKFVCPCHASSFDEEGNVLSSPAPRALDYLPLQIQNGRIWVDTNQTIRRQRFNKKQLTYA